MEQVREERTPNTMPSGLAVMSVSAPDTGGGHRGCEGKREGEYKCRGWSAERRKSGHEVECGGALAPMKKPTTTHELAAPAERILSYF